jgi:hypothetical protein
MPAHPDTVARLKFRQIRVAGPITASGTDSPSLAAVGAGTPHVSRPGGLSSVPGLFERSWHLSFKWPPMYSARRCRSAKPVPCGYPDNPQESCTLVGSQVSLS